MATTSNGARRARRPRTSAGEHDFNTAWYTWRDKGYPEIRGLRPPTPPIEPFNTDPDSVSQQEYKQACSEYERKLDDYDAKVSRGTTREAAVRKELREQRKYEEPERKKAHLGFLEAKSRVATATFNELWEISFETGRTPNGRPRAHTRTLCQQHRDGAEHVGHSGERGHRRVQKQFARCLWRAGRPEVTPACTGVDGTTPPTHAARALGRFAGGSSTIPKARLATHYPTSEAAQCVWVFLFVGGEQFHQMRSVGFTHLVVDVLRTQPQVRLLTAQSMYARFRLPHPVQVGRQAFS
ncbi:MAG: hypothetical protein ACXVDA_15830 [Ktedonobacterales bacterium]